MRALRFTLPQMALVVALALGPMVALLAVAQRWLPEWQIPGMLPLLAVVAVDAVVTERVVVSERLSLAEQGALRAVEWLLLIVAVRIASVSGEDASLLEVLQPWLRDPLAFFRGRFSEYLLPAVVTWGLATLLAETALHLESERPRPGVRSLPNEEAAALQDRAAALAGFDRAWLFSTLVALAAAAAALYHVPLLTALKTWSGVAPIAAVLVCVLAGLLLHSHGQFDQLSYAWHTEQAVVDADVPRRWRRASRLVVIASVVLGGLLGWSVLLAPPPPLVPLINVLLIAMTFALALVVAIFGILLLPFAWLLSLLTGGSAPSAPTLPPIPPPQIPDAPGERPLLPALIFWSCIILLVVLAGLRYVQQRQDLRALIGRWPGLRRLMQRLSGVWQELEIWTALAVQTVRERLRRRQRAPTRRRKPPRDTQAQLRALYRRMVHAGQQRGVPHPPSQTPNEFGSALSQALPPADPDVTGLTEAYVTSEYGPQPAQPQDVRRARMHWRRLERLLSRKGRAGSVETEGRDGDDKVSVASAKPTTSGRNESIRPPRDL